MNSGRPSARSRRASASRCCVRCRARCSSTWVRRIASRRSFSHGFWMKSRAPRRMASTASPTLPQAVITMTGMLLSRATISESRSRPFLAGSSVARVIQVDEDGVVELAGEGLAHRCWRLRGIDGEALGPQQQLERFQNVRLIVSGQNAAGDAGRSRVSVACYRATFPGCFAFESAAKCSPSWCDAVDRILNLNAIIFQRGPGRALQFQFRLLIGRRRIHQVKFGDARGRAGRSASGSSIPLPASAPSA